MEEKVEKDYMKWIYIAFTTELFSVKCHTLRVGDSACHDSTDVLAHYMQLHYLSWADLIARCLLLVPSILSPQKKH